MPVMAAKTSLFHVCKNARFAISIADKQKVNSMANLVPKTKRSSGRTSSVFACAFSCNAVLSVILRVNAFFTKSVNGCVSSAGTVSVERGFFALVFSVDGEAVEQNLRFRRANIPLLNDGGAGRLRQRHRGIVNAVKAVAVAESVLNQNHVLAPLAQYADEYAQLLTGTSMSLKQLLKLLPMLASHHSIQTKSPGN